MKKKIDLDNFTSKQLKALYKVLNWFNKEPKGIRKQILINLKNKIDLKIEEESEVCASDFI